MIKVVFFAALREQLNCSELSLSSENLSTVADLKNHLASTDETWQQVFTSNSLLSAVNHDMVSSEQVIKSGDEVAFFPPVMASILGWIFLDEKLSILAIFGGGLVIFGALLVNLNE